MSWFFYYLWLALLFLAQVFWKHSPLALYAPDFLFCSVLVFALVARPSKLFFIVLPAALIRATFSLDSTSFILGFFALSAFFLQEGRALIFPEKILTQITLAFLSAFAFFVLNDWISDGASVRWREFLWNAAMTAVFAPIFFLLARFLPFFRPLLVKERF